MGRMAHPDPFSVIKCYKTVFGSVRDPTDGVTAHRHICARACRRTADTALSIARGMPNAFERACLNPLAAHCTRLLHLGRSQRPRTGADGVCYILEAVGSLNM